MTEEDVTIGIMDWLESNGWEIICFDYPQSGTGICLHLNQNIRETKNKDSIIPDIVAIKGGTVVFFENKDHFDMDDFLKVDKMRNTNDYSESIENLLADYQYNQIIYGVGLPEMDSIKAKVDNNIEKIDFAILINEEQKVSTYVDKKTAF